MSARDLRIRRSLALALVALSLLAALFGDTRWTVLAGAVALLVLAETIPSQRGGDR